jgi:serine/threonine protein phosphatase PrpC
MKYVVLGSDGLWDELGLQECAGIVLSCSCAEAAAKALLDRALSNVARRYNLTPDQLHSLPISRRRKVHDDISVVVIPLQ